MASRLTELAKALQDEADRLGLGVAAPPKHPPPSNLVEVYDALISSEPIRSATRKLFVDGHYAEAVEEAFKCVNNSVKQKSGVSRDGQDLMLHVFDEKKPLLKLNELETVSQRDEQAGYKFILAGCMTGIRNPRAHEHGREDEPQVALEMLVWANHLMRVVERAKRARQKRDSRKS